MILRSILKCIFLRRKTGGHGDVFCQNLIHTLENYSNFKNSILEINGYYKTRRNASFNELSEIINTL